MIRKIAGQFSTKLILQSPMLNEEDTAIEIHYRAISSWKELTRLRKKRQLQLHLKSEQLRVEGKQEPNMVVHKNPAGHYEQHYK